MAGSATYNGKQYSLLYMGKTKYGNKAKLSDGTRTFWVSSSKVSGASGDYQKGGGGSGGGRGGRGSGGGSGGGEETREEFLENYVRQTQRNKRRDAWKEELRLQEAATRMQERKNTLQRRYGNTVGGAVDWAMRFGGGPTGGKLLRAGGAVASSVGGSIVGGATAGFFGTVEGNRFYNEIKMINRELAGAFLPVMKAATSGFRTLRTTLQGFGEAGQNMVMLAGLSFSAYKLARFSGIGLGGFGSGAASAVGSAAGSAATSGKGGAGTIIARTGVSALLAASAISGFSSPTGGREAFEEMGMGRKTAGWTSSYLSAASPLGWANDAINNRRWGPLRLAGKFADSAGMAETGAFLGGRDRDLMGDGDKSRRRVTIADAGFDPIGSGYERIANAVAMQTAQDELKKAIEESTKATKEETEVRKKAATTPGSGGIDVYKFLGFDF
jgi:hypothetical protein